MNKRIRMACCVFGAALSFASAHADEHQFKFQAKLEYFDYTPAAFVELTRASYLDGDSTYIAPELRKTTGESIAMGALYTYSGNWRFEASYNRYQLDHAEIDIFIRSGSSLVPEVQEYGAYEREDGNLTGLFVFRPWEPWLIGAGVGMRQIQTNASETFTISSTQSERVVSRGLELALRSEISLSDYLRVDYSYSRFRTRGKRSYVASGITGSTGFFWIAGASGTRGVYDGEEHDLAITLPLEWMEFSIGITKTRSTFYFDDFYENALPYSLMVERNFRRAITQTQIKPDTLDTFYLAATFVWESGEGPDDQLP